MCAVSDDGSHVCVLDGGVVPLRLPVRRTALMSLDLMAAHQVAAHEDISVEIVGKF